MSEELCFCIEGNSLYLEKTLVEYENIPDFFLCKSKRRYYIALCIDIEVFCYIVVSVKTPDVFQLLHGKIPMRDIFLMQEEYWKILSGEEIIFDVVEKHAIEEVDNTVLPEEGACFKILTEEMEDFVQNFDNEFFYAEYKEEYVDFSIVQKDAFEESTILIETENVVSEKMKIMFNMYFEKAITLKNIEAEKCWKDDDLIFVAA